MSSRLIRRHLLLSLLFLFVLQVSGYSQPATIGKTDTTGQYKCMPCGYDCDTLVYNAPGTCAHCKMPLVNKSTVNFRSVTPASLCQFIKDHPSVVLLDVRTREEFTGHTTPNFGTLKNALNIPVQELEGRLSEIQHLKGKEIIVYCSRSHRSPAASYLLAQNGFSGVINLSGGMSMVTDTECKK